MLAVASHAKMYFQLNFGLKRPKVKNNKDSLGLEVEKKIERLSNVLTMYCSYKFDAISLATYASQFSCISDSYKADGLAGIHRVENG